MTDQAYGHQIPNDSSSDVGAVSAIVRAMMARMDTMKLVMVKKVTGGGEGNPAGTVDVQPLVQQIDGNGYGTDHGIVPGIPWSRLQAGKSGLICDPVVGDIGYVVAADRDTSKVRNTKAVALPGSRRRFKIADGVYAGSILGAAPTCYVLFTPDGHIKIVDVDGNVIQSSASGWTITPRSGQPVTVNGDIHATGAIIAGFGGIDQVGLQTHLHTSAAPGSPTSAPTPGS